MQAINISCLKMGEYLFIQPGKIKEIYKIIAPIVEKIVIKMPSEDAAEINAKAALRNLLISLL